MPPSFSLWAKVMGAKTADSTGLLSELLPYCVPLLESAMRMKMVLKMTEMSAGIYSIDVSLRVQSRGVGGTDEAVDDVFDLQRVYGGYQCDDEDGCIQRA